MRDELRVSRPEIDVAVEACLAHGALGARIVGGGFGGAVMALVKHPDLRKQLSDRPSIRRTWVRRASFSADGCRFSCGL